MVVIAAGVLLAVLLTDGGDEEQVYSVEQLSDRYWTWRLDDSPEFATYLGNHERDDRLESYSLASWARREEDMKGFLADIQRINVTELSEADKENLDILKEEIELFVEGIQYKGFYFPVNFLEGVQVDFVTLITQFMPLNTVADYNNVLARYAAFGKQVDEIIEVMRKGIEEKITFPKESMKGIQEQFEALETNPEDSLFYEPFLQMNESLITNESIAELQSRGLTAVTDQMLPALNKLKEFILNDYMSNLRDNIACYSLPNGEAMYKQLIRYHIGWDMLPSEIHDIGMDEVKRIKDQMQIIIDRLGFPDKATFDEYLINNETFYYEKEEDILDAYRHIVYNRIEPKLLTWFKKLPKQPVLVEAAPASQPFAPQAYYQLGTIDRPGVFTVNVADPKNQPAYSMVSLSLHEAQPGHHTQAALSAEDTTLHASRRTFDDRRYGEAPSKFPIYTAYGEGWGLYAERLGEDIGVYENDYEQYGRYLDEMLRACRLVVDTGMHALNWTRQDAMDFLFENMGDESENSIDRYITWPGQALAYKIGELKINDVRKYAESELGAKFNIKEFHDIFLTLGPGNLERFESAINEYVEQNKARSISLL
ncbi:PREDICTED: uncharacterized protein LOC106805722 [Priapulus caudatus]|uniref:Uncharacterized protein LOC106805722 n=1 Tax=Priapulus caudatus TaxID=37621 RepID=A0ABM1DSJ0_PRICU|nr:PREDICTED: uncharacterized protein LOC106805722 [Priapulus caudatus]